MDDWRELVPELGDGVVTLRAPIEDDYPAIVEWARDPESIKWTTIPNPEGGYSLADARHFVTEIVAEGWRSGHTLGWMITAEVDGRVRTCGQIDLRSTAMLRPGKVTEDPVIGDVGFVIHPEARGRGLMSRALRLVVGHGFDELGLAAIRWEAMIGNEESWRVAAAAGFTFEGVRRYTELAPGRWLDMWQASILAGDPRSRNPHPMELAYPQQPPVN
ncbi:GNAT family N-acetyltransferase [Enemella sp. A6]|uniref:GNAT family N-acetyltransferase n=1 Tax=Enemella sp. A6 TaxID=3440152 RepID=UPI003EC0117E